MNKSNPVANISTEQIVDKLGRAYEMEEAMSNRLVDLCRVQESITGLSAKAQADILKMLDKIREDTLRHKKTVMDVLGEFSRREG